MSLSQETINDVLSFKDKDGKPLCHRGNPIAEKCCMIILMMGPRRCGKTSVLTSISQCLKNVCAHTNLCVEPRSSAGGITIFKRNNSEPERIASTTKFFNNKRDELKAFADNPSSVLNNFGGNAGIAATSGIMNYDFVISCNNKPASMLLLRFIDVPGEYYLEEEEKVQELVNKSNCIIIAIDTPALMSGKQIIQSKVNHSDEINDYFEKLNINENDNKSRLILFTPLKSEKWFRIDEENKDSKQMDKIKDKIKHYYENTINKLSNNIFKASIAITPVMTIGGVKFFGYSLNKDGKGFALNNNGEPIPTYIKDNQNVGYYPKYCEQPLLYFFSFIDKLLEANQLNPGLWHIIRHAQWYVGLQQIFTNTAKPVYDELKKIISSRIKDEKGFAVISDEQGLLE